MSTTITAASADVDEAAVLAATAAVDTAKRALVAAEHTAVRAKDALEDASDDVYVAETKVQDYSADETKKPWQIAAAERDVAKKSRARDRAQKNVDTALSGVRDARRALDAADAELRLARATPAAPAPDEPTLFYGSTDEFVRKYLRYVYSRPIDGATRVWAAEWWRYDEAVIRLESLWRSWEHLRLDAATGMSVWFRDHADHHMAVLLSSAGPFASAEIFKDENTSDAGQPLPYVAPPDGMFLDERPPATDE